MPAGPLVLNIDRTLLPYELKQSSLAQNKNWTTSDQKIDVMVLFPNMTFVKKLQFDKGSFWINNLTKEFTILKKNSSYNLLIIQRDCYVENSKEFDLSKPDNLLGAKLIPLDLSVFSTVVKPKLTQSQLEEKEAALTKLQATLEKRNKDLDEREKKIELAEPKPKEPNSEVKPEKNPKPVKKEGFDITDLSAIFSSFGILLLGICWYKCTEVKLPNYS